MRFNKILPRLYQNIKRILGTNFSGGLQEHTVEQNHGVIYLYHSNGKSQTQNYGYGFDEFVAVDESI